MNCALNLLIGLTVKDTLGPKFLNIYPYQILFSITHRDSAYGLQNATNWKLESVDLPRPTLNCRLTLSAYSRSRLIRKANAWKNCANYPSMQIIRVYFTLHFYQQQRVVSTVSMRIKRGMRISEGQIIRAIAVADPGFPVGGGVDLVWGAMDPRGGYVSKILHVKMKESGPVGGGACRARPPLDPPMYRVH